MPAKPFYSDVPTFPMISGTPITPWVPIGPRQWHLTPSENRMSIRERGLLLEHCRTKRKLIYVTPTPHFRHVCKHVANRNRVSVGELDLWCVATAGMVPVNISPGRMYGLARDIEPARLLYVANLDAATPGDLQRLAWLSPFQFEASENGTLFPAFLPH